MPVMTGLESVKLLREMGCDSTILMVTGHALEVCSMSILFPIGVNIYFWDCVG